MDFLNFLQPSVTLCPWPPEPALPSYWTLVTPKTCDQEKLPFLLSGVYISAFCALEVSFLFLIGFKSS